MMFSFRTNYSYEDLDEQLLSRSARRSRRIIQYFLVITCTIGVCLFVFLLSYNYSGGFRRKNDDLVVLAANSSENENLSPVLITLDQGELRGKRMISRGGREYLAFLGIPYAKPPIGNQRFQPTIAAEPWNGTLDATEFKPWCIQRKSHSSSSDAVQTVGSEDCLYLNVYTPKTLENLSNRPRQGTKLPVMIYVHGGIGGAFGNINRNGAEYLLDEDVILVTFHYRLGVLGNLNTNDGFAKGNQGLKDNVMAFKWVKNNIVKFGGDSNKVTLFGESYGSMSISAHLISPMTKDLFHRVICQSGTIIYPGSLQSNSLSKAFELGSKTNCTTSNNNTISTSTEELVTCLQGVDAVTIILKSLELPLGPMEFTMSVESYFSNETIDDVYLPDFPMKLYQNLSNVHAVSAMMGITSAELVAQSLAILSSPDLTEAYNNNWEQVFIKELKLDIASEHPESLTVAIHDFYFGSSNISEETERNLTFMFSDRSYTHPNSVVASFQLETNKKNDNSRRGRRNSKNVYLYRFNYPVNDSYSDYFTDNYEADYYLGAGHADELQFLFPYEPFPLIPLEHKDANFSKMMVHLWATFADTGIPDVSSNGVEWTPINGSKPYSWLQIEEEPRMITGLDSLDLRMQFWDSLNLTELYI